MSAGPAHAAETLALPPAAAMAAAVPATAAVPLAPVPQMAPATIVAEATAARILGQIDAIAQDDSGRLWLLGWLGPLPSSRVAVAWCDDLAPARPLPAAGMLDLARFARERGGGSGMTGFCARLSGEAPAELALAGLSLQLALPGRPRLTFGKAAAAAPLAPRRLAWPDFLRVLAAAEPVALDERLRALRLHNQPLAAPQAPAAAQADAPQADAPQHGVPALAALPLKIGLDAVVAIPGVGYMVEGWALSPQSAVTGFVLQVAGQAVQADPRCTYRRPRSDLAGVLPGQNALGSDAGFVAFFPFADPAAAERALVLHLQLAEGHRGQLAISAAQILWLSRLMGEAELLHGYPALHHEPFFPATAALLRRLVLMQQPEPVLWQPATMAAALLVALPDDRSEAFRLFDQLLDWLPRLQRAGTGLLVMAPQPLRRTLLPLWADLAAEPQADAVPRGLWFAAAPMRPRDVALALQSAGAERALVLRQGFVISSHMLMACLAVLPAVATARPLGLQGAVALPGEGPPGLLCTAAQLQPACQRPLAWADLQPLGPEYGAAQRSCLPPPPRPLQQVLARAGIWL